MRGIEKTIERLILTSRYILVVFYVGLAIALGVYALNFILKLYRTTLASFTMSDTDLLLAMLVLIDGALVASLIVMVMLSSYENFIGRFDDATRADSPSWLGRLDPGSLKIKVAAAIIAISSVHLLQVFMNTPAYTEKQLLWKTLIHLAFIVSAIALGYLDKMSVTFKPGADEKKQP